MMPSWPECWQWRWRQVDRFKIKMTGFSVGGLKLGSDGEDMSRLTSLKL